MFGRRKLRAPASALPPHPGPDADGVSRVIPMEIWESELGSSLRELGLSPDDENNVIPDAAARQSAINETFDRKKAEQDRWFAQYNENPLGGATLIPFAMLPWEIWQRDHAPFLLGTLEMYPVESWNTLNLPEDEKGSLILDLPQHPHGYPRDYIECCHRIIGEVREEHEAKFNEIGTRMMAGDHKAVEDHAPLVERTQRNIVGVAFVLAGKLIGEDAVTRHRTIFGPRSETDA